MIEPASNMTAVAGHDAIGASHSAVAVRDMPLDAVKGILVVLMVVYHAMNIFSTAGAEDYAHIRFVSGSFIFVSGYIVASFYYARFKADWGDTSKRLVLRGVKLLALFTLLNVLINLTGVGNPDKVQLGIRHYINNAYAVYISGAPGYASFNSVADRVSADRLADGPDVRQAEQVASRCKCGRYTGSFGRGHRIVQF